MKWMSVPVGFLLCAAGLSAQNQAPPGAGAQAPATTIRTTAQEVMLDMVFRDKKGKTIRDIRPEEIHVTEEGADQKLTSLRLVEGKTARSLNAAEAPAATGGSLPLDPLREIRLVSLVFEGLDVDGKRFFRQAVKDILDMAPEQNLYFSILTIDQKLQCIQPFTNNHAELLASLERSLGWSYVQFSNQSAQVKEALARAVSGDQPQLQASATGGPSAASIQALVDYQIAKLQYDMLKAADAADREYSVRATIDALLSLVRAESQLPGRKVVLYFNPWLNISTLVKEQYDNMVGVANRANVSFYTVDPKGLVTWSQGGGGRDDLSDALRETRESLVKGNVGEVSLGHVQASERAESALRSNPLLWLRDLARKTGGATIAETNDWKAPLRTAMEEVRTYYEATYTPQIAVYDGRFRSISVRVDRPNVVVHTRSGYFALPSLKSGQQLYAYEMPLLNALNAPTAPSDVVFHAAAERFNVRGPKVEYMVTLEAPLKGLVFNPLADNKTASVDAGLLAVVRDSRGEIVEKFSKDFAVEVALDKVEAYKGGNLVQTFRTELAPGAYKLESAVMDRQGNKIGVQKGGFDVPQPSTKLSISDVVVVRRADPLKDNQILDAFYFPGGKVVPTLTGTLKGGAGNVLPFYFSVYPDPSLLDAPKLTMAFYKDGQYLGAAEAPLPPVQKDGRIPYIANLPADKFVPGAYEIRLGVTQGGSKAEEKVKFQVE